MFSAPKTISLCNIHIVPNLPRSQLVDGRPIEWGGLLDLQVELRSVLGAVRMAANTPANAAMVGLRCERIALPESVINSLIDLLTFHGGINMLHVVNCDLDPDRLVRLIRATAAPVTVNLENVLISVDEDPDRVLEHALVATFPSTLIAQVRLYVGSRLVFSAPRRSSGMRASSATLNTFRIAQFNAQRPRPGAYLPRFHASYPLVVRDKLVALLVATRKAAAQSLARQGIKRVRRTTNQDAVAFPVVPPSLLFYLFQFLANETWAETNAGVRQSSWLDRLEKNLYEQRANAESMRLVIEQLTKDMNGLANDDKERMRLQAKIARKMHELGKLRARMIASEQEFYDMRRPTWQPNLLRLARPLTSNLPDDTNGLQLLPAPMQLGAEVSPKRLTPRTRPAKKNAKRLVAFVRK